MVGFMLTTERFMLTRAGEVCGIRPVFMTSICQKHPWCGEDCWKSGCGEDCLAADREHERVGSLGENTQVLQREVCPKHN